jgi:hypothetical protein
MILDPRNGDVEDDHASHRSRSLLSLAGSLLIEISPIKAISTFIGLVVLPALLLGFTPLIASIWLDRLSVRVDAITGFWSLVAIGALIAAAYALWHWAFWAVEASFWSLNALLVQPGHALCREALRHVADHFGRPDVDARGKARRNAAMTLGACLLAATSGVLVATLAWPETRWQGTPSDLVAPARLLGPVLANAVFVIASYTAIATVAWGIADASMEQPRDLAAFATPREGAARWRVAHLSDVHVVGQRFGFRVESGRRGPRGNTRFHRALDELEQRHRQQPLDVVMITGDMTDAGLSTEWAEFLDALHRHPELGARAFILPGNHDLNIIDSANPARLELPLDPARRLRKVRALAAMAAVQGDRVRVVEPAAGRMGPTLNAFLRPHRAELQDFADTGSVRLSPAIDRLWRSCFPQVMLPATATGLGVILLDSNADSHFSFTNALGLLSAEDERALAITVAAWPRAHWVLGLHHHLLEYPQPAKALSERIGTALINGSWFVRKLQPVGHRLVAMHGHRHKDWIGTAGTVTIVSAPSPVMNANRHTPTHFYVHTLQAEGDALGLLPPERVDLAPEEPLTAGPVPVVGRHA